MLTTLNRYHAVYVTVVEPEFIIVSCVAMFWVFFFQQQYEFIYDMVAMYLQCGITVINAKQLPYVVQDLALKLSHSKCTGFEREFKVSRSVLTGGGF